MVHSNITKSDWDVCGEESSASSDPECGEGTTGGDEESAKRTIRKTISVGGGGQNRR